MGDLGLPRSIPVIFAVQDALHCCDALATWIQPLFANASSAI
jgi:hypothetical protein